MKVRDLLKSKGFEVIAVDSSALASSAVNKMVERNIGAVLVMDEGKPVGLFTERDALRCWIRKGEAACDRIYLKDVMTKDILIVTPDDDIDYAMAIMIERNIRHLPVVEHGMVISMLSIRDIVRSQISSLEAEIYYLKDYISDKYPG